MEKYSLKEVFCKKSPVTQKVLKGYVQRHNIIPYKCAICGCNGVWMNGIIALELHHIDGDTMNNTIENLEYRCPNCHALTKNYREKNKQHSSKIIISKEDFLQALKTSNNIRKALIKLNLKPKGANYKRAKDLLREI